LVEIVVKPITGQDRDRWAELWRGYLDFYEARLPPEIYDHTWQRLIAPEGSIHGLGARLGSATAPLVGIAHYLFHAHAWTTKEVCYLQDLFVDPTVRRGGVGRRLIEAVAAAARERGCHRLY
jgi:GNAT superfamily N-acetyltransferase